MSYKDFNFDFDSDSMKADLDRVEKKPGEQTRNHSDKFVILPKKEGSVTVRLLPADTRKGRRLPYASTRLHYLNNRRYHCLKDLEDGRWKNGVCPICSRYNFLYSEAKKASSEQEAKQIVKMAKNYRPVEQYYYNCMVRKEVNPETGEVRLNVGPKILQVGKQLHGRILRAFLGNKKLDEAPLGNIAHPLTGRDLKINKEITMSVNDDGQKVEFPNYDSSKFLDETSLGDPKQVETWLETLWDLEAIRQEGLLSPDELMRQIDILEGRVEDDSAGFSPNEWEDRPVFANKPPVAKPVVQQKITVPPKAAAKKQTGDVPFDTSSEDFAMVEEDWQKEFESFKAQVAD